MFSAEEAETVGTPDCVVCGMLAEFAVSLVVVCKVVWLVVVQALAIASLNISSENRGLSSLKSSMRISVIVASCLTRDALMHDAIAW